MFKLLTSLWGASHTGRGGTMRGPLATKTLNNQQIISIWLFHLPSFVFCGGGVVSNEMCCDWKDSHKYNTTKVVQNKYKISVEGWPSLIGAAAPIPWMRKPRRPLPGALEYEWHTTCEERRYAAYRLCGGLFLIVSAYQRQQLCEAPAQNLGMNTNKEAIA